MRYQYYGSKQKLNKGEKHLCLMGDEGGPVISSKIEKILHLPYIYQVEVKQGSEGKMFMVRGKVNK